MGSRKKATALAGWEPKMWEKLDFFGDVFPDSARRKGIDLQAKGLPEELRPGSKGECSYEAIFPGRGGARVQLWYEEGGWKGTCTCPVALFCKHAYAALLELTDQLEAGMLAKQAPPEVAAKAPKKAAAPEPKREPLVALLESRLGRRLKKTETDYARLVSNLFAYHGKKATVPVATLHELMGWRAVWEWQSLAIWPQPPRDVWETWLYVAHFLRGRERPWPDFLAEATTEEELASLVAPWERQKLIAAWKERLESSERAGERVEPRVVDLRLLFGPEKARLETQEAGGEWRPLKKTQVAQLGRDLSSRAAELVPPARLLWLDFQSGGYDLRHELPYAPEEGAGPFGRLLRNPLLAERLLDDEGQPLQRPEQPLRWHLETPPEPGGDYRFLLRTAEGEAPAPARFVLSEPDLYVTHDSIFRLPALGGLPLPTQPEMPVPAEALENAAGVTLLTRAGLELPARLAERTVVLRPRLVLEAELSSAASLREEERLRLHVLAEWEDGTVEQWQWTGWQKRQRGRKAAEKAGQIVVKERSPLREAGRLVGALGATWEEHFRCWERRVGRDFPEVFSRWLLSLPAHAELRLDRELASLKEGTLAGKVELSVEPGQLDWFDVDVKLSVPEVKLTPEELQALLGARGGWVRLGEKGWRRLALQMTAEEEESLAELGLSPRDLASGEKQRLHALQLGQAGSSRFLTPDRTEELRRRARELQAGVAPAVPATVQGQLRPYQVEGFHFLAYLSTNRFGGLLADDMGLGKTLQTLTWLVWLREQPGFQAKPSLVVCPKSVMENWSSEAARFAPHLRVRLWRGLEEKRWKETVKGTDLLVLNFAQLRSLQARAEATPWHVVILDEAQAIKNPDSQTNRAACALPAEHRLALTGTPIENRLLDLWAIMAFVMPGMLGPRARFARTYDAKEDPWARRRLAARTRPFLLRRTKEQVARDLPARVEEELLCEMEGMQATLYQAELKRARQALLGLQSNAELDKVRFHILSSLLRLRQICCHPGLVDARALNAPGAKMDALLELLEPLVEEGRKVLVFSQFVGVLEILEKALAARGWPLYVLTGQTEERGELIQRFQTHEGAAVFLLSLKASGFGLNLTSASYVVLYDPWWNPAVENQAIDRTHRIGQTETVFAYRLLVKGTIEEKIRLLQKSKRALADDLLGEEAFARALTLEDLRALLQ